MLGTPDCWLLGLFLEHNIDLWLLSHNSAFSLSLLIVFISPPHLPISLCLQGDILIVWMPAESCPPQREREREWEKRKLPLIPGAMDIFCRRPSTAREKPTVRLVDISSSQISKSKNPSGRSCTWTRVWSFRGGYYCHRAQPPLQSAAERVKGGEGDVGGGSVLPPSWSHGVV